MKKRSQLILNDFWLDQVVECVADWNTRIRVEC